MQPDDARLGAPGLACGPDGRPDRYLLVDQLSSGGLEGPVWRAYLRDEHDSVLRLEAVKMLRDEDPAACESWLRRWSRVQEAIAYLRNPHLVGMQQAFLGPPPHPPGGEPPPGRVLYLPMEYVDGATLQKLGEDFAATTPGWRGRTPLLAHLAGVASALEALASRGLVHRDVKPSNVVTSPRGAVLVDLGLVHHAGSDASQLAGSEGYAPPEAWGGAPLSPAADVYSLAAVAYFLLARRLPPPGHGVGRWPGALSELDLPPQLAAHLLTVLSAAPDGRPRAGEWTAELLRLAGQPAGEVSTVATRPSLSPSTADPQHQLGTAAATAAGAGVATAQLPTGGDPPTLTPPGTDPPTVAAHPGAGSTALPPGQTRALPAPGAGGAPASPAPNRGPRWLVPALAAALVLAVATAGVLGVRQGRGAGPVPFPTGTPTPVATISGSVLVYPFAVRLTKLQQKAPPANGIQQLRAYIEVTNYSDQSCILDDKQIFLIADGTQTLGNVAGDTTPTPVLGDDISSLPAHGGQAVGWAEFNATSDAKRFQAKVLPYIGATCAAGTSPPYRK